MRGDMEDGDASRGKEVRNMELHEIVEELHKQAEEHALLRRPGWEDWRHGALWAANVVEALEERR